MGNSWEIQSVTNTIENSCTVLDCDCNIMWSLIQQMSTVRLCRITGRLRGEMIPLYSDRARRIAATYARFYLEQEEDSDPAKKGRFYWMALGAFASKTVACSLDDLRVAVIAPVLQGLAKGNLWLFYDISGWHWYYIRFNGSFDICIDKRDASAYVKPVKDQMDHYPWKDAVLPKINNMHEHAYIVKAFNLVRQIEEENDVETVRNLQLKHLMVIATHEQEVILQPLIYDDPNFAKWVKRQRIPRINFVSPELQMVFSSACDTKNDRLKSIAPKNTELEKFSSRMSWINEVAQSFHGLMQQESDYMEDQLNIMAGWVTMDGVEEAAPFVPMPIS